MESDSTAAPHLEMSQWVIYAHPRDYPGQYAMRRWDRRAGTMLATDDMALADSLEEIREALPPGLYRLGRFPDDNVSIVEVWV